jgi:hypothetical protein
LLKINKIIGKKGNEIKSFFFADKFFPEKAYAKYRRNTIEYAPKIDNLEKSKILSSSKVIHCKESFRIQKIKIKININRFLLTDFLLSDKKINKPKNNKTTIVGIWTYKFKP